VETEQTARTLFVGGLEVPEHCPEAQHLLLRQVGGWRSVIGLLPPHPVAERWCLGGAAGIASAVPRCGRSGGGGDGAVERGET
jgi:hypothetical protein